MEEELVLCFYSGGRIIATVYIFGGGPSKIIEYAFICHALLLFGDFRILGSLLIDVEEHYYLSITIAPIMWRRPWENLLPHFLNDLALSLYFVVSNAAQDFGL